MATTSPSPNGASRSVLPTIDSALLRGALDVFDEAILIADYNDAVLYANSAALALYESSFEEIVSRRLTTLRAGDEREAQSAVQVARERLAAHGVVRETGMSRRQNGTCFPVWRTLQPIPGGNDCYLIRERPQQQGLEPLEDLAKKAKQQLERVGILLDEVYSVSCPVSGRLDYVSPSYEKVWGRPSAEIIQNPASYFDTIHPDDRTRVWDSVMSMIERVTDYARHEYRILRPDGGERWVSTWCIPVLDDAGQISRIASFSWDITERKRAESALLESTEKIERGVADRTLELAAANETLRRELAHRRRVEATLRQSERTTQALLACIPDRILRVFQSGECIVYPISTGRESRPENPSRLQLGSVLSPELASVAFEAVQETLRTGEHQCVDLRMNAQRRAISYEIRAVAFAADEALVLVRDVTERKQAEEDLRANERRLRDILDAIGVYVGLIATDGTMLEVNKSILNTGQVPRSAIVGVKIWDTHWFSHSEQSQILIRTLFQQALQGRRVRKDIAVMVRGDRLMHCDALLMPLFDEEGRVELVVASGFDITARIKSSEEITQLQHKLTQVMRRATVDQMAVGIAHELNQPLTAINKYSHALRASLTARSDCRLADMAQLLGQQAERAGDIIRGLRDFAGKGRLRFTTHNLNDLIRHAVALVAADMKSSRIVLETEFAEDLPEMSVDSIQIQQVVLNLVRNAMDALESTARERRIIRIVTARPDEQTVRIFVSDTGPGIPAEKLETVFQSFFTTKPSGLGFGLSLSRSIVEAHGGRLWAHSSADGATFICSLPLMQHEAAQICLTI